MKLKHAIALALAFGLLMGRPGACTHEGALQAAVANLLNIDAGGRLYNATSGALAAEALTVTDYYFFSVGRVKGHVITIGALRFVYVRNEILTLKLIEL